MTEEEIEELWQRLGKANEKEEREWREAFGKLPKEEQERRRKICSDEHFAARMTEPLI